MWNVVATPHRLGAVGNGVHAGNPGGTRGGTDGGIVEAEGVPESLLGQIINGRSLGVLAPVAAHPGDPVVFTGNPQDIGLFRNSAEEG